MTPFTVIDVLNVARAKLAAGPVPPLGGCGLGPFCPRCAVAGARRMLHNSGGVPMPTHSDQLDDCDDGRSAPGR